MVNRSKAKGTTTETLVVRYLQSNGWPYAERRALSGSQDKGDVAGMPGLAVEVKYGNGTLKIGPWLTETGIERLNAAADHGILVVKPFGMGEKNVHSWYAVMVAADFQALIAKAERSTHPLFVVEGKPWPYTARTLAQEFGIARKTMNLAPREALVVSLKPRGAKDAPEKWYKVMSLYDMTRLLRAAGYGEPEVVDPVQ